MGVDGQKALERENQALRKQLRQVTLEKELLLDTGHKGTLAGLSQAIFTPFYSEYLTMAVIRAQADPATRHLSPLNSGVSDLDHGDRQNDNTAYYPPETPELVEELCTAYLVPEHQIVVFRIEQSIGLLINPKSQYISESRVQQGNYAAELKWKLSRLLQDLDARLSFHSIITLSSIARHTVNLRQLYLENIHTYDYIWDRLGGVHAYEDLNTEPMSSKDLAELSFLEQEFMDHVARTLYSAAAATLNQILHRQLAHTVPLQELTAAVTIRLQNVLAIIEYSSDFPKVYLEELSTIIRQLSGSSSIPELQDRISDFFSSLADFTPSQEAGKGAQILEFIRSNYKNPRLNAQMLCDRFRISRAYLSILIKKTTGQGLVELIHYYRVESAKELLRETKLTIEQVAQQVGFSNRYGLIRAFRECTGQTPSEYRQRKK